MNTPVEYDAVKATLIATNSEYRELQEEHHHYEARLQQLTALQFPTAAEQDEEHTIKHMKLALKDRMEELLHRNLATIAT